MENNEFSKIIEKLNSEAKKALINNDVPIAAIIYDVKTKTIISKQHNKRHFNQDVFDHAEILCLKEASKKIGNWHMNDFIIFVSTEPCLMCLGAILESRIKKIIYCTKNKKRNYISLNNSNDFIKLKLPDIQFVENKSSQAMIENFFRQKIRKRK